MSTHVERLQGDLDLILQLAEEDLEDPSANTMLLGVITGARTNIEKARVSEQGYLTTSQLRAWRRAAVAFIEDALSVVLPASEWEIPERTHPDVDRQTRDLDKLRELHLHALAEQNVKGVKDLTRFIKLAEVNLQTACLANGIYLTREEALADAAAWFEATQQIPEVVAAVKVMSDDPARKERFGTHLDRWMGENR